MTNCPNNLQASTWIIFAKTAAQATERIDLFYVMYAIKDIIWNVSFLRWKTFRWEIGIARPARGLEMRATTKPEDILFCTTLRTALKSQQINFHSQAKIIFFIFYIPEPHLHKRLTPSYPDPGVFVHSHFQPPVHRRLDGLPSVFFLDACLPRL